MADKAYEITIGGDAMDDRFYDDVASLTVDESTTEATSFHLRLATSLQDDGTWAHLDVAGLALFTRVSIRIGFTGGGGVAGALGDVLGGGGNDGLEAVFDGYLTRIDRGLWSG